MKYCHQRLVLLCIPENGYGSRAPPFGPDMYFPQESPFMQNSRLFGSVQGSVPADYSCNMVKPDPDSFFGHACPSNPFVRPHYPHFPFSMQPMTSSAAAVRLQNPIQCQWVEVRITSLIFFGRLLKNCFVLLHFPFHFKFWKLTGLDNLQIIFDKRNLSFKSRPQFRHVPASVVC